MTIEELIKLALAVASVDELELYAWARPQLDSLRNEFYQSRWPTADFPIWLRRRFLELKHEQPSPAPSIPLACTALTQASEPATGFVWMYGLTRRALH